MYLLVDLSHRSSKLFNCSESRDKTVWIGFLKSEEGTTDCSHTFMNQCRGEEIGYFSNK